MKITHLAIALFFSMSIISCKNSANLAITTEADSVSYILGAFQGKRMVEQFERAKLDSLLDMDLFLEAFHAATQEKELKMIPDSNKATMDQFFQTWQTSQMLAARDTIGAASSFNPEKATLDSISYLLGAFYGQGIIEGLNKDGLDTILKTPLIIDGYAMAIAGKELKLDPEANMPMLEAFFQKLQEDQLMAKFGDNKRAGEEFLAKNKGLEEVTTTASGLQYEVITEGNGPKPSFSDQVKVHYHGTFVDGTVFDSSVASGKPATFGVGRVIKGWTEALQLMPVGSKWKLYIPYDIAYGAQGSNPTIPPFSMLIFEVELLEIVK
jgi:FKBP-type peptidyl-prolyl cis-trans isomerase